MDFRTVLILGHLEFWIEHQAPWRFRRSKSRGVPPHVPASVAGGAMPPAAPSPVCCADRLIATSTDFSQGAHDGLIPQDRVAGAQCASSPEFRTRRPGTVYGRLFKRRLASSAVASS
jgi:hypothetical protein